jgi:hypothetical protein
MSERWRDWWRRFLAALTDQFPLPLSGGVAELLGVGVGSVGKAVTEHKATLQD